MTLLSKDSPSVWTENEGSRGDQTESTTGMGEMMGLRGTGWRGGRGLELPLPELPPAPVPIPCLAFCPHTRHFPPNALSTNAPSTRGVLDTPLASQSPTVELPSEDVTTGSLCLRCSSQPTATPGGSWAHCFCPPAGQP